MDELQQIKRYNLAIPQILYDELEKVAKARSLKVIDILRTYIEFGLWFDGKLDQPETSLVLKEGGKEKELILFSPMRKART